jgi:DNA-binding transcriptional LysR family regulator
MSDFSLHEFAAVNAVATHRSFRSAAAALQMPPSSLSHMIASVEKRLGIRLFQRSTRHVSLTVAGEAFLTRLRPALQEMTDAIESANSLRDGPTGQIRINSSAWAAERILPVVLDFMRDYPEVQVDVVTDGRIIDLVAEGFDAGLRLTESVPQSMVALPLGHEEALIIVAAPAYLERQGTPLVPADLLAHDCLRSRLPSGAMMRWEVEKAGEQSIIDVSGRLVLGTTGLTLKAAIGGAGIAYVMARDAEPSLQSGALVQLLTDWTPSFPGICLYYPRLKLPSAAFRAFVEYFKGHPLRGNGRALAR